ncbi:MAG TPA: hypothetical protein PK466_03065 [Thermotogota bacterium]|nr:hypothetical protein [Thermotogota bacterium]HPR95284.1 hypothetical protein [Thermotogota bacterium]
MKRIFLLAFLLILTSFMLFASVHTVEFVSFSSPDDYEESISLFDLGMGFKKGDLDPVTNALGEGTYFQIGISEDIGDDMIAEMKADEATVLETESYTSIDGYSVEVYSGTVEINETTVWFKTVYFPFDEIAETDYELVFLAMSTTGDQTVVEEEMNQIVESIQIDAEAISRLTLLDTSYLSLSEDESGVFIPGELISVGYYIPAEFLDDAPWIGIVPSDVEHGSETVNDQYDVDYVYLYDAEGVISMNAPDEPGYYDFRMNDSDYDGKEVTYLTFEVASEVSPDIDTFIYIDDYTVAGGSYVPVYFEGMPGTEFDWIGAFPEGADDYGYESYAYTDSEVEGVYDFWMPEIPGYYTLRAFNGETNEMIAESEPFEITVSESYDEVSLTLDKTVVYPDEEIICYFYNAPGNETDWIGIYEADDVDNYIVKWDYTDGSLEGYLSFNAPLEPGNYIFRFMPNDTFDIAGESEVFAVLNVETTEIPNPDEKVMVTDAVFCETVEDDFPVNEKIEFSYSEESVYFWLELGEYVDAHEAKWEWVYPDGTLYDTVYLDVPSAASNNKEKWDSLSLWSWIPVKDETDKQPGIWKVNFYLDEELVAVKQFMMKKAEFSKKPDFLKKTKKIELGDINLVIPSEAEFYDDSDGTGEYYIVLNPEEEEYAFIGVVLTYDDYLYEEGTEYSYSSDELYFEGWQYSQYDEDSDITDEVIDLVVADQYDSYGNYIYIYLMSPQDQLETWEPKFLEILDSMEIND